MSKFIIGTSGYIGSKNQWLSIPDIDCLEINSTFYRLPTEKSIANLNALIEQPQHKNLIFSVKVSKFITHIKRFKDCKQAWNKFHKSIEGLGKRVHVFLFQTPPSFKYNKVNFERLQKLTYLPKTGSDLNIVFEFRDKSWFDKPDVVSLFKKNNWVLGGTLINTKGWMGSMPTGLHLPTKTANCTYLRIHGGRGYRSDYNKKQLDNIEKAIDDKKTKNNYVIFNNVFFEKRGKTCKYNKKSIKYAALCNAATFGKMTRKNRE